MMTKTCRCLRRVLTMTGARRLIFPRTLIKNIRIKINEININKNKYWFNNFLCLPVSDDDDEDMPMSPESFDDDGGSPSYFSPNLDDVTAQLAAAGGLQGEKNAVKHLCGHGGGQDVVVVVFSLC